MVQAQPCSPSPCGPNSQCRPINNQAVCSCLPTFIGTPPSCRPECTISAECPLNEACNNHKCINPCLGSCGIGAKCEVVNHNPICSCPPQYTGDPFARCSPIGKYYQIDLSSKVKIVRTDLITFHIIVLQLRRHYHQSILVHHHLVARTQFAR